MCRSTGTTPFIGQGPSYLGHSVISRQSLDLVTKDKGCACISGKACRAEGKIPGGDNMEDVSGMGRESIGDPIDDICPDRLEDGGDLEARKAAEWLSDKCTLASGLVVSESGCACSE